MACFGLYSDFTSQQNVTIIYLTLGKRWRSILRSANCNYPTIWVHLHNCLGLGIGKPTETNKQSLTRQQFPNFTSSQKSPPNHMHGTPVCLIPSFLNDRNIFQGAVLCLFQKMLHRDKGKKRERDVGKGYPVSASIDCSLKQCVLDCRSCSFSKRMGKSFLIS